MVTPPTVTFFQAGRSAACPNWVSARGTETASLSSVALALAPSSTSSTSATVGTGEPLVTTTACSPEVRALSSSRLTPISWSSWVAKAWSCRCTSGLAPCTWPMLCWTVPARFAKPT